MKYLDRPLYRFEVFSSCNFVPWPNNNRVYDTATPVVSVIMGYHVSGLILGLRPANGRRRYLLRRLSLVVCKARIGPELLNRDNMSLFLMWGSQICWTYIILSSLFKHSVTQKSNMTTGSHLEIPAKLTTWPKTIISISLSRPSLKTKRANLKMFSPLLAPLSVTELTYMDYRAQTLK